MARPTRVDFPGAWYHVLNRGIEKRVIFRSRRCYEKFMELLSSVPKRFGVPTSDLPNSILPSS
jgi:putative transposase